MIITWFTGATIQLHIAGEKAAPLSPNAYNIVKLQLLAGAANNPYIQAKPTSGGDNEPIFPQES
jgi:hypothetical protein